MSTMEPQFNQRDRFGTVQYAADLLTTTVGNLHAEFDRSRTRDKCRHGLESRYLTQGATGRVCDAGISTYDS